jgi:hypothetical protein
MGILKPEDKAGCAQNFSSNCKLFFCFADRELNAWCSLRKTCQYQSEMDEQNDVSVFKSKGNNFELKKKVLPSLFAEDPVCLTNSFGLP